MDELLAPFAGLSPDSIPMGGWLREIRITIGMPLRRLGDRLGMTASGISQLERREADGAITLEALRKAADGLDCDLVYALVPRAGSVSAMLEQRARAVAGEMLGRVSHTMGLEDQATSQYAVDDEVEELVRELLARPRELWP